MMSFASFEVSHPINGTMMSNVFLSGVFVVFWVLKGPSNKKNAVLPSMKTWALIVIAKVTEKNLSGMATTMENSSMASFIYMPMFMVLGVTLATWNLLGLLPWFYSVTAMGQTTLCLSLCVVAGTMILSLCSNGLIFCAQYAPFGVHLLGGSILVTMETVSHLMTVISLGVSLAVNMTAGHLLLSTLSSFYVGISTSPLLPSECWFLWAVKVILGLLMIFLLSTMVLLELFVAVVQTYVFCVLSAMYASEQSM